MMRYLLLALIAATPANGLRIFLYKRLFGFRIAKGARIGMFSLLDARELLMEEGAAIRGVGNIFLNVRRVEMGRFSSIGAPRVGLNLFRGSANKTDYPKAVFRLGHCSIVELMHYFDICADISIGDNVVIGGIKSVFFTHAFHIPEFLPVRIGDNVYVGSNCLFQMGVSIPPNSIVAMGSVVVKPIEPSDSLIGGVPAKPLKTPYGYDAEKAYGLRKRRFYKDGVCAVAQQEPSR